MQSLKSQKVRCESLKVPGDAGSYPTLNCRNPLEDIGLSEISNIDCRVERIRPLVNLDQNKPNSRRASSPPKKISSLKGFWFSLFLGCLSCDRLARIRWPMMKRKMLARRPTSLSGFFRTKAQKESKLQRMKDLLTHCHQGLEGFQKITSDALQQPNVMEGNFRPGTTSEQIIEKRFAVEAAAASLYSTANFVSVTEHMPSL